MPAILRIFVYQTDASLYSCGSTPSYDQGGGLVDGMVICNTMRCLTLSEVYAEQPVDCDAAGHYHHEVEYYVIDGLHVSVYCGSRPVTVGNGAQWPVFCFPI